MTRSSQCVLALSGLLLLASCARSAIEDALDDLDAAIVGLPEDAGVDGGLADGARSDAVIPGPTFDAGSTQTGDAGEAEDAAEPDDADEGPEDAGEEPEDAAEPVDARTPDAGPRDAGPEASVPDATVPSCPAGETRCGTECVNTSSESAHCGTCGNACAAPRVCTNSACVAPPPTATGCTSASRGGHNYLVCTGREDDWVDARRSCMGFNMDLAVPNDASENDFLQSLNNSEKLWVGVSDRDAESTYRLVQFGTENNTSGTVFGYNKWKAGEPNNTQDCTFVVFCNGDEDCVELNADGTWNDAKCSNSHAYACESY